jgi:3-phosphoshikimate 1-carboxyvinyltransferase
MTHSAKPLKSSRASRFSGEAKVPGDKSISHRALMFASQALGTSRITGLLEGEDVLHTAKALQHMGVSIRQVGQGEWEVDGVSVGDLAEPLVALDMGNSGTSTRLLMGLLATLPFPVTLTGDASLSKRPMKRVMTPLEEIGAQFIARDGDKLPLTIKGTKEPVPIEYRLPVASAQVKSAILLAGLNTPGKTTVIENTPTRDHTERVLREMGAQIDIEEQADGSHAITITGYPQLKAQQFEVPADPSSAAFLAVAALLVPGSDICLKHVCVNPTRTGIFETLKEMGADIRYANIRTVGGEDVADIIVKYSPLTAVTVPASRAPSMIDEYPVLAIAATVAKGTTRMEGLEELRVKESDRLAAMEEGLRANHVVVRSGKDWLEVDGSQGQIQGGGIVDTKLDHRIAMSFMVLGLVTERPVQIDDGQMIQTSFPGFEQLMNSLGAQINAA